MSLVRLLPIVLVLALSHPAFAQWDATITFTAPDTIGEGHTPGTEGILVFNSQNFREAGMHVEAMWRPNEPQNSMGDLDFVAGHFHSLDEPTDTHETSHGFDSAELGLEPPDRQGFYLVREDGGPFSLVGLDYRLTNQAQNPTNLWIATEFDPQLLLSEQLENFTVLPLSQFVWSTQPIAGFEDVTQIFLFAELGLNQLERIEWDDFQIEYPEGSCNPVPRGTIYRHAGAADPLTEGWTAEGGGVGIVEGAVFGDLGKDAWSIEDPSGATGSTGSYAVFPTPDEMCWARHAPWTLRATARVVQTPDAVDGSVFLRFFDGLTAYELHVGSDALGDPVVDLAGNQVTVVGAGSGYHTYELSFDPATETVDLSVDAVPTLFDIPGAVLRVSSPRVAFGSDDEAGTGHGHWSSVEFVLPPVCSDGIDNDGDGLVDAGSDPGCRDAGWPFEAPKCQDGIENDTDGKIDFDGGASLNGGIPLTLPDPQCVEPWKNSEAPRPGCGFGFELALLLPVASILRRRLRR